MVAEFPKEINSFEDEADETLAEEPDQSREQAVPIRSIIEDDVLPSNNTRRPDATAVQTKEDVGSEPIKAKRKGDVDGGDKNAKSLVEIIEAKKQELKELRQTMFDNLGPVSRDFRTGAIEKRQGEYDLAKSNAEQLEREIFDLKTEMLERQNELRGKRKFASSLEQKVDLRSFQSAQAEIVKLQKEIGGFESAGKSVSNIVKFPVTQKPVEAAEKKSGGWFSRATAKVKGWLGGEEAKMIENENVAVIQHIAKANQGGRQPYKLGSLKTESNNLENFKTGLDHLENDIFKLQNKSKRLALLKELEVLSREQTKLQAENFRLLGRTSDVGLKKFKQKVAEALAKESRIDKPAAA